MMRPSSSSSARQIRRELIRDLSSRQGFKQRLSGWSQRFYYWLLRIRGAIATVIVLSCIYAWWFFGIRQATSASCLALLAMLFFVAVFGGYCAVLSGAYALAVKSITPQVPFPDRRTWNESLLANCSFFLWLAPGLVGSFVMLANLHQGPVPLRLWLGCSGFLAQLALIGLVAELILRLPSALGGKYVGTVGRSLLIGPLTTLPTLPFATATFIKMAGAVFPLLWYCPLLWPTMLVADPPAFLNTLQSCFVLSVFAGISGLFLICVLHRNATRYRITEVWPYLGLSYVYGFSPHQSSRADLQAYDAWADSLLAGPVVAAESSQTNNAHCEASNSEEAGSDNVTGSTYFDWTVNAYTSELQRWDRVAAAYPLRFLSTKELAILKVRCVSSELVVALSWLENAWKSIVLAALLYLLPPLVAPVAAFTASWILFGKELASLFASGFTRIHGLPYRIEEVLFAESKYRVLCSLILSLPLLSCCLIVGMQMGLTFVQSIDLGCRLLLASAIGSVVYLYVIIFESGENTWLRYRSLAFLFVTLLPVAVLAFGAVLLVAETGWIAYCGAGLALLGLKLLYHTALYWYYHGDMDFTLHKSSS